MNQGRVSISRVILIIVLSIGAILMIAPFIWMLLSSFKFDDEIIQMPPTFFPEEFTFENYREVFIQIQIIRYFINSIVVSGSVTLFVLFSSTLAGYIFAKHKFPGRELFFILTLSTMMLAPANKLVPHFMIMKFMGWIDTYQGLIAPFIVMPFGILMARQFSYSIPNDMIDCARVEGCSEFRIYYSVIIPSLRSAMSALTIFTFMFNWNLLLWPVVIINSTELRTLPLGVAMFTTEYTTLFGMTMAMTTLVIAPVVIVFLMFQKQFIQGLALTGMKG